MDGRQSPLSRAVGLTLIPLFLAGLSACADGDSAEAPADSFEAASNRGQAFVVDESSDPNILNLAMQSEDHQTLVAAVQAAEMENILVNAGPLTVFAPTDEAFAELPEGTLEELLRPENKQKLYNIVASHASPGNFPLERLQKETQLYQATGHYVDVEVRDDGTYVNGAKILASVPASNGIIHVVDGVFLIAAG
ncbi:MAG: fasciclin domain-containing protein [Longimicrobiales bacterium]|nr:fasciclin domain-containing protein [Longimicrobiales bacterium]